MQESTLLTAQGCITHGPSWQQLINWLPSCMQQRGTQDVFSTVIQFPIEITLLLPNIKLRKTVIQTFFPFQVQTLLQQKNLKAVYTLKKKKTYAYILELQRDIVARRLRSGAGLLRRQSLRPNDPRCL